MAERQWDIENNRIILRIELMVANAGIDEGGRAVARASAPIVDVPEDMVLRLNSMLNRVQKLSAAGQQSVTFVPGVVVAVPCKIVDSYIPN